MISLNLVGTNYNIKWIIHQYYNVIFHSIIYYFKIFLTFLCLYKASEQRGLLSGGGRCRHPLSVAKSWSVKTSNQQKFPVAVMETSFNVIIGHLILIHIHIENRNMFKFVFQFVTHYNDCVQANQNFSQRDWWRADPIVSSIKLTVSINRTWYVFFLIWTNAAEVFSINNYTFCHLKW